MINYILHFCEDSIIRRAGTRPKKSASKQKNNEEGTKNITNASLTNIVCACTSLAISCLNYTKIV